MKNQKRASLSLSCDRSYNYGIHRPHTHVQFTIRLYRTRETSERNEMRGPNAFREASAILSASSVIVQCVSVRVESSSSAAAAASTCKTFYHLFPLSNTKFT